MISEKHSSLKWKERLGTSCNNEQENVLLFTHWFPEILSSNGNEVQAGKNSLDRQKLHFPKALGNNPIGRNYFFIRQNYRVSFPAVLVICSLGVKLHTSIE